MKRIVTAVIVAIAVIGGGQSAGAMDVNALLAVYPAWIGSGGSGSSTAVIGDSLVDFQHDQVLWTLAANGNRTYVTSSGGSSFYPWNVRKVPGNAQDLGDIPAAWGARTTVVALGANDARLMTQGSISFDEESAQVRWGIARAVSGTSGCVILVQPSDHWSAIGASYPAWAQQLRNLQTWWAAATNNAAGRTRVRLIDWNAQSAGHESWFNSSSDIHNSAIGQEQYRNFIVFYVNYWRNAC